MRAQGTTTVEIKSGYGLTLDDELRSLRIAREFTAAHDLPRRARRATASTRTHRAAYVDLVTGPMLDAVVADGPTASPRASTSSASRTRRTPSTATRRAPILEAGRAAGLALRVHGNQLGHGPGVRLACELGARSVDHCTYLDDADVEALVAARGTTVATLLPGVEFSTRSPYPDARALIDAGVDVALATRLQPRHLLLVVDALRHRARGARDGHDAGRGAARRDRRVGALARPRPPGRAGAAGRARGPRRAEPPAPRLPRRGADRRDALDL